MHASYLADAPPRILAHRGLALEATENTQAAFAAALRVGASHLETDARASSDGRAVLWHDEALEQFDGSSVAVARTPMRSLATRRSAGRHEGDGLLALDDALDAFPDARFNIDVKSDDAVDAVVDAVLRCGAQDRVLVTSFSSSRLRRASRALPLAAHGVAGPGIAAALVAMAFRSRRMLGSALRGAAAVQIPRRHAGIELVTRSRLRAFRSVVPEVHVWTVNDPAEMAELLDLGVDGLVTDRADLAAKVVLGRGTP